MAQSTLTPQLVQWQHTNAILDSLCWKGKAYGPVEPQETGVGQIQLVLVSTVVQPHFGAADKLKAQFL